MAIQARIAAPSNTDDARSIVDFLVGNLNRNHEIVRDSLREWDQNGCHLFAQALKGCHYYDHGNVLGQALRNLANTAIMREHRLAARA